MNPLARLPAAPPADDGATGPRHAQLARRIYRARRRRDAMLGPAAALFADPAWDVVLDLFVAHHEGSAIGISSACIAANVPPTTALRYINSLIEAGLIEATTDPADRRLRLVRLTGRGVALVDACMTEWTE